MALVIESGVGAGTLGSSYVSAQTVADYAASRGKLWAPESDDLAEAACRTATGWIDGKYRGVFPGYKRNGRAQVREWPRLSAIIQDSGVSGWGYVTLPESEIPREIIEATCEAAIRELGAPGSLAPDLAQGGGIVSVSAGSASVTFAGAGLTDATSFMAIDMILAPLLIAVNQYGGSTGRG